MAYLVPYAHRKARCVFKGLCDHAPATETYYHEFTNYSPKPVCPEHARRIRNLWRRK